jgi:3-phenylpropionate/trans-cinnamate dioxygenase ferredoxin subunit
MPQFVEVARLDDFIAGGSIVVRVADTAVALFNVAGQLFAIGDSCVRCGSSLAGGLLLGRAVVCSRCQWQYDVATGCLNGIPSLRIDTFQVRTLGARVMVADKADDGEPS